MISPAVRVHTDAIIEAIRTAGIPVSDGDETPTGAGWQGAPGTSRFVPWVRVQLVPGGLFDGTLAEPQQDASLVYELDGVGPSREAAERTLDRARTAVFDGVTVDGRTVVSIRLQSNLGTVAEDVGGQPRLWAARERHRIDTDPA